jgi:hypothetical protein
LQYDYAANGTLFSGLSTTALMDCQFRVVFDQRFGCRGFNSVGHDDVVNKTALDNPKVYDMAKKDYHTLKAELSEPLPDFDEIYQVVNDLYKSLPWDYASE